MGQTKKALHIRIKEHLKPSSNMLISRALRKYGKDNFTWTVIAESNDLNEINKLEAHYIDKCDSLKPNGYNLHTGGNNHITMEETKRKLSEKSKGKHYSPATEIKPGQRISPATEFKKGIKGPNRKLVIDLHSGTVFDSINEAAKCFELKMKTLSYRLNQGVKNKRFAFID